MKLILGSSSKFRREILQKAGYTFTFCSPEIDEKALRSTDPYKLPLIIARAKAQALIKTLGASDATLITADQVVVCNGILREKPNSDDDVRGFFNDYAKYPAETVSALVVTDLSSGKQCDGVDIAKVHFSQIPSSTLDQYIQVGGAMYCSGAFEHEHPLLHPYIQKLEGESSSVSGMPLTLLAHLLDCLTK